MEFFSRRQLLSPLLLVLVYFTYLAYARSHHIRHHRDRFKRQQGAHLYLPGSYVTDGDDEPDAGPWLEWSSPSQCSRTCGGGVSTQYRQCTPGYRCSGPTRRHFSCNTQDCPDLADFRAIQCAEFNNSPFEGTLYEWVPYTKSPQPCELNCMPRGERFYYRHKLQVVDGTKCNDESVDVCVQGKCQPVGCDMMLGSDAREDQCRVCEGDGSTCNTMNGLLDMQDLQVGYNDILLIPAGAVNINVREANRSNNYLAIRNATGHYYLNGNWRIDFPRTLEFAGSKFHYERSPQGFSAPDTITSIGPIEESLFIVLLYQDTNVGIHYEYSIPKSVQHPTYIETYAWTFDQFTPCSSSCGGGYQSRNVSCAGRKSLDPVNSTLCDANNKPVETQRCGEIPCEPKWVAKQWEKCSATCGDGGTQTRKIYCEQIISAGVPSIVDEGQCANVPKPSIQQACNQGVVCGEWHAGPWKPCNRLCGKGKETRDITCYRKVDGKITVLDGKECTNSQKPEASRSCVLRPCEGVDWVASEWSGCQNKCGLTEETRAVQCMTASGETFPDALCAEDEEKPETTRKCVTRGCEYEWYASQWSECSAKCGSGIQTRKVFCTKPIDEGFTKVDESNCDSSKKYEGSRNCSAEATECPGEWFSGPWTKCTKVCGGGVKMRKVLCIKGNTTAHVKECDPDLIPSGSEECNKAACDKDEVIPVSTTKLVATTTEIPTELEEEDDEYEIVEDDECEDGEWVDVDGIPQRKLSPSEKLSLVSKSLGESTDTDLQTQADNPFAEDELMLGDFPGDADSLNAAAVTDASGDYSTYSPLPSGFSFEGSGDTIEASGDGTGLTEVTESFSASRMYTLGSSLGTFETFGVTDEPDTFTEIDVIRTSDGVESTEMRSTDITTEEPISKETVAEISLASFEYSTSDADTETTEDTIETSEGTTEQPETSATEITTEVSGITDEVATKVSESTEDTSTKASESTEEETATKASESTEETATKASESTEEETATKASESTEDETATKASESTEETATKASESTEETATESTEAETATKASESTEEETATKVSESTEETATKVSEPTEETATKVSESTEEIATKVSESTEETVTKVTGVSEEDATDASKITSEVPEVTVTKAEADVTDVTSETVPVSSERIYTEATDITSGLPDVTTEESDDVSSKEPPSVTEETDITDVSSKEPKVVASEAPTTEGVEATTEKAATDITQVTTEEAIASTKEPSTDTTEEGITSESAVGLSSVIVETTSKEEIATEKEVTATTTEEVSEISSKVPAVTEVTQIPTTTDSGVGITEIEETTIKGAASTVEEFTKVPAESGTTEKIEITTETEKVEVTEEEIVTTEKEIASTTEPESVAETTTESLITTTVASVISSVTSMFTKFISLGGELTTDMTDITEEGTTQETITEAEKVTGTTEEPEEITNKTTEFDIWSSTESTVTSTARTTLIEIFTTRKIRWCKRVKKPACKRSEFGCCPDKITPAKGPFDKGCPIPTTCKETKYGCCEDGVSPASGVNLKGCPTSQCDQTLFGCCPDTVTPSQGNNNEGCPPPPPECAKSIFGCCEDNATEAQGPNSEGCKEKEEYTTEEEEIPTTTFEYTTTEPEDCKRSAYGCCPDGVSVAQGESFKGCDLIHPTDCNKSYYNCCPDGVTSAEGPNFQGCKIECLKSAFGCCDDGITPAHGYNKEGCCLNTQFGCCPDNIQPAHGPKEEGCGCAYSKFGCCPDNVTAATGRNIDGCGCQYAQFGCCPDNHAVATGADYEGCACHTFQFGCCPDGVTVARGLRNEGCGCVHSEFGCCSDKKTAANGPNFAGCDCVSSIYGCCPDGNTEAQGENFEGCIDAPEDLQEHCQLAKDRGTCRNYTVRWFYDMEYGGCSRFWYGGCDGNGNRFKSKEDCNNICVEPVGKDRCNLPKVSGPCEGYYPQWYYDKTRNLCTQFIYGGCLGNNNRFETRDECNELCVTDSVSDPCELPQEAGPCHGDYINWYYNKESGYCEQFIYGGCKGNSNNFLTEAACKQKCAPASEKKPSCSLPKVQGECTELLPRWYYDTTEERCMPFYFTGCSGNSNNFASQYHCELDCPKQHVRETCQLPADSGECSNYVGRFYYDTKEKSCKHFYYGGCGGNKNNFDSEDICMARCKDGNISEPETITTPSPAPELPLTTQGPEPFKIEFCYLPPEAGPCRKAEARWYYDNDATCKQFAYGGCGGNRNNFLSSDECAKMCGDAEDICHLPMVPGPCHADYVAWYYNQTSATCEMFKYGGCMGNGNKFNDLESCEKRCKKIASTTAATVVEPTHDPTDPTRVCLRSVDHGTCNETIPAFFYDPNISKCAPFTYTGCGGNDNRFTSPESCERFCGTYRGHDPCSLPSDVGPCRAALRKFYFDMETATCQEFTYGGCFGNANRFSTIEECNSVCGSRQPAPQPVLTTVSPAEICLLTADTGTCEDGSQKRWYYDNSKGECIAFIYSGCGGNANNFNSHNDCQQTCRQFIVYEPQPGPEAEPPQPAADCTQYQEECSNLRCQYGMKGYVENLCNRCKCVDPCEEVTCSSETRCGVEPNRNQNDSSDTSPFVGVCREINKPGDCPIIRGSGDDCREECRDDADCPIDLLCCSNGCGYVCLMPAVTTFAPPSELRTTSFPVYTHRPLTSDTFAPEVIEDEFNPIVTAGEGDYATLKCAIRGNPRPRFTWSKENVLIDGKEPRYRILLEGAALQIISLYKTDAGIYLCSADNNIGKPLRKEIRLEVIDPVQHPTRVIDDPELSNVVVSLGSPAMLNCYAYGYPPPVVMWWKDNEFIPFKSNEYTISKDHTLLINGVKLHNLGLYTCQAYNGIGKATSWSVTVQTIGPVYSTNDEDRKYMKYVIDRQKGPTTPRPEHPQTPLIPKSTPLAITSSTVISTTPTPTTTLVPTAPRIYTVPVRANITLSNTNYPVGSSIHIHCDVEGFPIPTVQWYKDSQPLSPSQTLQITGSHRLIINNATEADSGEYRCAAWNQYSNATSTIPLYIQGRFIHPSCKDNPFFANCPLIIKANFCSHKYYARFCCRSCTEAGKLPSVGPHLRTDIVQNDQNDLA